MPRLALKVAYDGTRFSGSQWQPQVRTVHGELQQALRRLGLPDEPLRWAGRTDGGVSAAGNVVVLDVEGADERLLPSLTFQMEDAWVWAMAEVPDAFEPRHALGRRYRYFLRTDADAKPVEEALQAFVGTHDFSRFARVQPGVNPARTVTRASAARRGAFVVVDVEGPNFLWNQVRRMVSAAEAVATGAAGVRDIARGLAGEPVDLGLAPPEPLVLLDVRYGDVAFRDAGAALRGRLFERLEARLGRLRLEDAVLSSLLSPGGAP
jgi:tRNA pseudouridine38-40 synthase